MASWNFSRGVILFQVKRQMDVLAKKNLSTSSRLLGGDSYYNHGGEIAKEPTTGKVHIGKREVVGYGNTGEPNYIDHVNYPFPAIRFREDDAAIAKLREKEKGDWKKLTLPEKKDLYRASFCSTFAEMTAPTSDMRGAFGIALVIIAGSICVSMLTKVFVSAPELPVSFEDEYRAGMAKRFIDQEANPVQGYGAQWDYEKGTWKK